jgi:hypothetical protein
MNDDNRWPEEAIYDRYHRRIVQRPERNLDLHVCGCATPGISNLMEEYPCVQ